MAMKEERRGVRRTPDGKSCQYDRASDGERRVGRPRRIVPLAASFVQGLRAGCSAMPALRDVACHIRDGARGNAAHSCLDLGPPLGCNAHAVQPVE